LRSATVNCLITFCAQFLISTLTYYLGFDCRARFRFQIKQAMFPEDVYRIRIQSTGIYGFFRKRALARSFALVLVKFLAAHETNTMRFITSSCRHRLLGMPDNLDWLVGTNFGQYPTTLHPLFRNSGIQRRDASSADSGVITATQPEKYPYGVNVCFNIHVSRSGKRTGKAFSLVIHPCWQDKVQLHD
jgi:hypothetical protein